MSSPEGAWLAAPLPVQLRPGSGQVLSTVGAGDAQVAGLLAARHAGLGWQEALRYGVAFATAKLGLAGADSMERQTIFALENKVEISEMIETARP